MTPTIVQFVIGERASPAFYGHLKMFMVWPEVRPSGSFVEGRPETHGNIATGGSVSSLASIHSQGQDGKTA